jgi:hypothetical protein
MLKNTIEQVIKRTTPTTLNFFERRPTQYSAKQSAIPSKE